MKNKEENLVDCPFCNGTGIAKCVDFAKLDFLPNGHYDLNELTEKYGEYTECPEGCRVLN